MENRGINTEINTVNIKDKIWAGGDVLGMPAGSPGGRGGNPINKHQVAARQKP